MPSTNWNVLQLLHEDREEKEYPTIINIASCSLQVLHGAFKRGMEAAGWDVGKVLKAIWQFFHDSPARREMYSGICESEEFPLKQDWISIKKMPVCAIAFQVSFSII